MVNQIKKSIKISGHKTSVALEKEFWFQLNKISHDRQLKVSQIIEKIDKEKRNGSLASKIRVYILKILIKNQN